MNFDVCNPKDFGISMRQTDSLNVFINLQKVQGLHCEHSNKCSFSGKTLFFPCRHSLNKLESALLVHPCIFIWEINEKIQSSMYFYVELYTPICGHRGHGLNFEHT